ncbi:hypothetical protein [Imhoffiella purpurea]|uniref:Uncharacterized protein n=1 Tax=Imhoffiella purpurea TaxID=1249627 RepID=W9V6W8_9GAMM|nr:hypothetical protein [Imhoffiella purpurea]EXJ12656.1 hypothetical protein D779_4024 [Imhoffiella purpurea]
MDPRWLTYLDAHIARGLVATEAESAETLSWLLKLEPEQRWCLMLKRDPCLKRLVADDYRRVLTMMVELEADSLAAAPGADEPCVESGSGLSLKSRGMISLASSRGSAAYGGRRAFASPRLMSWALVLVLAGSAAGIWWLARHQGQRLETLADEAHALQEDVETRLVSLDRTHRQVTRDLGEIERQRRATQSFLALSAVSEKLSAGQAFSAELAALEAVWPEPGQLDFLEPLAEQGIAEPEGLISELARLNETLEQRNAPRFAPSPYGPALSNPYAAYPGFARAPSGPHRADAARQAGLTALSQARRGDWQAALDSLSQTSDPAYRDWSERVSRWLAIRRQFSDLRKRIWSQGALDPAPSTAGTAAGPSRG